MLRSTPFLSRVTRQCTTLPRSAGQNTNSSMFSAGSGTLTDPLALDTYRQTDSTLNSWISALDGELQQSHFLTDWRELCQTLSLIFKIILTDGNSNILITKPTEPHSLFITPPVLLEVWLCYTLRKLPRIDFSSNHELLEEMAKNITHAFCCKFYVLSAAKESV